jgi:CubicO group peptidase (beta-lactamase class C family)
MMRHLFILAAFLLASLLPVSAQTYDFSRVTRLLNDSLTVISTINAQSRGATVMVNHKGRLVYNQSVNRLSGTWSPTNQVPIASATKWLSAATIATLVDDGLIRLDDSIGKYLPIFTRYGKGKVTIRQCFSHTSGWREHAAHTNRAITLQQATDSIAAFVEAVAPAGTVFSYGGTSMHVAGRIAEVVTGQVWDTLFKRRIAAPLGMVATNYDGLGLTDNPQIAGGAQSNPQEYLRFVQMLLDNGVYNGRQIISKQMRDEILKDQTAGVPIIFTPYIAVQNVDATLPLSRYGLGCWLEKRDTRTNRWFEMGSQGAFGWSPWIDTTRQIAGVFGVYYSYREITPTYLEVKKLVSQAIGVATSTENTPLSISVKISPNPTQNELTIVASQSLSAVYLVDILGRTHRFSLKTSQKTLDVSTLRRGRYIVQVFDEKGVLVATQKLVKM